MLLHIDPIFPEEPDGMQTGITAREEEKWLQDLGIMNRQLKLCSRGILTLAFQTRTATAPTIARKEPAI